MYVAPVETDPRSAPSAGTRGSEGSSDFFAELLRRHREVNEPAPRPRADAERQTGHATRERNAVPTRADARDRSDAGKPVEPKTEARPEPERAATASPDTREPVSASNPRPADHPADVPATVVPGAVDEPQLAAVLPATPATVAVTDGDTPVQSAPASATPAAAGAVPTAGPDLTQAGTPTQATVPAGPGASAPTPTGTPAQAASAAAPAEPLPGDAAADPLSRMPSTATVTEAVEPETKGGQIPAPALGLGKLGSGAEIALSAQAAGATPQPATSGQTLGQTRSQATGSQTSGQGAAGSKASDQPAANLAAGTTQRPSPAAASPSNAATPSGTESFGELPAGLDPAPGSGPADQLASGAPGNFSDLALRAAGRPVAGTFAAAAQLPAADQVAVQIQRAVRDGASRIIVQLNPAELGQVEVQLEFAQDGRVSAAVLAERADTLDMLQRDARLLERSLQEAGLKTDSGSLSFDLRDGGRSSQWSQGAGSDNRLSERATAASERAATVEAAEARPPAGMHNDGGVDIRV